MTERKHLKKSGFSFAGKLIAILLFCTLVGGVAGVAVSQTAVAADAELVELSAADIYEQSVASTVGITTSAHAVNYWGYETDTSAAGSGFIISENGYILTNYHVIEDAEEVKVATYDGETYDAEIIGYDDSNDIAVLKIDAENLVPVKIGDSDKLRVGEEVIAIGNPLGELTFTLTKGVVSALNRDVTIENGVSMKLIQTDCAINSGNSGGALFNMKGEVIGITNAKYSSSSYGASVDNIGFAIPINSLIKIYESIIENGYILKPFIGITGQTISEDIMQITGLKGGVRVYEVSEDSPAAEAGLQSGDVIISANGKDLKEFGDLSDMIAKSDPGDKLEMKVYRQGQTVELTVEIGSKTQAALKEEEPEEEEIEEEPQRKGQSGQDNGNNPFGDGQFGGDMDEFYDYFFGNMPGFFGYGG